MKLAYVAGPFRAATGYKIRQNIRRAEAVALELWQMGYAVVCPHLNTANFQGEAPDELWLHGDLEIIKRCDLVVLTPEWERSQGTRAERAFAERQHIPVFDWRTDGAHGGLLEEYAHASTTRSKYLLKTRAFRPAVTVP